MIIASGIIEDTALEASRSLAIILKYRVLGLSDSKTGLLSIWTKSTSSNLMFAVYDGRFRVYVDTDLVSSA